MLFGVQCIWNIAMVAYRKSNFSTFIRSDISDAQARAITVRLTTSQKEAIVFALSQESNKNRFLFLTDNSWFIFGLSTIFLPPWVPNQKSTAYTSRPAESLVLLLSKISWVVSLLHDDRKKGHKVLNCECDLLFVWIEVIVAGVLNLRHWGEEMFFATTAAAISPSRHTDRKAAASRLQVQQQQVNAVSIELNGHL